jgi:hypothetical protein
MAKVTRLRIKIRPIFHLSIHAGPFPNELVKPVKDGNEIHLEIKKS